MGVYDRHWAASNCVLTTSLTIYGIGLRGNSVDKVPESIVFGRKGRKSTQNEAKNRCFCVWDVEAAGSDPVTPTTKMT